MSNQSQNNSDTDFSTTSFALSDTFEHGNITDLFLYKYRSEIDELSAIEKRVLLSLLKNNMIAYDQAEILIKEHRKQNQNINTLMVDFGFINEGIVSSYIASADGGKVLSLQHETIDIKIIKRIPRDIATNFKIIPLSVTSEQKVKIAAEDLSNVIAIDIIKSFFPEFRDIDLYYASWSDISQVIDSYLGKVDSIDKIMREISDNGVGESISDAGESSSPIVKLVKAILNDGVQRNCSDIHFEPDSSFVRVRYRIDGVLQQVKSIPKDYWKNILVRIKVTAGMNIAESKKPQDGKINMTYMGRSIDCRVASHPTIHGENIVIRILDHKKNLLTLEKLGIAKHNLDKIFSVLKKPNGVVICTGPTGSGKTTSLYAMLSHLNNPMYNIMTLEDPVEYNIPLVRQTNIKENTGFTFDIGIRSTLRQNPDVILIGEVRDEQTAKSVIRAAMTGHRVLTTLHTTDSTTAVQRLIDIGADKSMISGNINAILSQRLVRKLCKHCKKERYLTEEEYNILKVKPTKEGHQLQICDPVGCSECDYTGYKGRVSLMEVLEINNEIDELICQNATKASIREAAIKNGFIPMSKDAKIRIFEGTTTISEAMRVMNLD